MSSVADVAPQVMAAVRGLLEPARAAWPGLELADDDFTSTVLGNIGPDGTVDMVEALHGADLYLACACARGDAAALAAFEAAYADDIEGMLRRVRTSDDRRREAGQRLRVHLFVAEPGARPRIADYAGRGRLRGFLRVVAVRIALQLVRQDERAGSAGDADELLRQPDADDDPELQYLKELYRNEFKAAFEHAVGQLSPRDRTLLRYHLVERLTIDQLAALDGTPRSTAARHLANARAGLVEATQLALAARLDIDADQLRSVMRLVQSTVDVSVSRLLS